MSLQLNFSKNPISPFQIFNLLTKNKIPSHQLKLTLPNQTIISHYTLQPLNKFNKIFILSYYNPITLTFKTTKIQHNIPLNLTK